MMHFIRRMMLLQRAPTVTVTASHADDHEIA